MKFHEYLDTIYLNENLELQKNFDLKKQAITRVIPDLIDYQRRFYKLTGAFTLIYGYFKARFTGKYPELSFKRKTEETTTTPLPKPTLVKTEVSDVEATPATCS